MSNETERLATLHETVAPVRGWLMDSEGVLLYRLARRAAALGHREAAVVEIGSWEGRSTIWLASGVRDGTGGAGDQTAPPVVAVDPWTGSAEHHARGESPSFDTFKKNIARAGVADLVTPRVQPSAEAARTFDRPVALLFIDGAHDEPAVREDFALWAPKVIEGGFIALHDTVGWRGPRRVAARELMSGTGFDEVGLVGSIAHGRKVACNSPADRRRNRRMRALLHISNGVNRVLPPALEEAAVRLAGRFQ